MDSIKILTNKEEITPIADEIRQLNGTTELMDLNTMTNSLDEVNNKINIQATKLDELKTILAGKASGGGGGGVETCTVTITLGSGLGSAANLMAYTTSYLDGVISAVEAQGNNTSVYVLENVVCGSMFSLYARYYTPVPGYTLGNGVTAVDKYRSIFRAPTQAGVNGTIYIFDDM